ncbi:hypothetical protein GUITHDRAFT_132555 [Guillardia theta CCMP2712]|uniref:protein O-GlcNAc transferase n=1 Tax=Guillardia theta (strain CCMP2712) TaxID=905079 RepID=L1K125_GUITC|nr:hypothetical protein GUITHDRAFT_132555 [Guillardia theta CCMP2712]EKX54160.1 hypothetical protein GUITHDRAFT_132555 [Guillardia theta CCMP2712]|eukprot:XP_005841140.1 hypothetical protein GUITHDRAFT_132555 [Guillardia theta CCMP2712]
MLWLLLLLLVCSFPSPLQSSSDNSSLWPIPSDHAYGKRAFHEAEGAPGQESAMYAVDREERNGHAKTCSDSGRGVQPVLHVDLERQVFVHFVEVISKISVSPLIQPFHCRLTKIYTTKAYGKLIVEATGSEHEGAARVCAPLSRSRTFEFHCGGSARLLTVRLINSSDTLAVCDVNVWAEDPKQEEEVRGRIEELHYIGLQAAERGNAEVALRSYHLCVSWFYTRMLATCLNDAGNVYLALGRSDRALLLFRKAARLVRNTHLAPTAVTNVAMTARELCDWTDWDEVMGEQLEQIRLALRMRRALLMPYLVETYRLDPPMVLRLSEILSEETFDQVNPSVEAACEREKGLPRLQRDLREGGKEGGGGQGGAGHVHVGFYSVTGLNAARLSIGRFLQSVIALHNSSRVLEAFCYGDVEHDDGTRIYRTIAHGCSGMKNMHGMSFTQASGTLSLSSCPHLTSTSVRWQRLRSVREDKLHVMVDLTGFTHQPSFLPSTMNEGLRFRSPIHRLMAAGVAPLHVSWWGYTGTLGAEFVHYVATDVKSSPPEWSCSPLLAASAHALNHCSRSFYSEKFLYLPGSTYLVSDHAISRREVLLQHDDVGNFSLPSETPAFIQPRMEFDPHRHAVPTREEVLGLSSPSSFVLCSFNQFYKLDPEIWSTWMRIMRRAPEAVLWMLEFNGKAVSPPSSVDALWSGVPVLTLAGEGMAARVASSLVLLQQRSGVTVSRNLADYEDIAVRLLSRRDRLRALREELRQQRWQSPLFDTIRWFSLWERQIKKAVDLVLAGYYPPAHMHII